MTSEYELLIQKRNKLVIKSTILVDMAIAIAWVSMWISFEYSWISVILMVVTMAILMYVVDDWLKFNEEDRNIL